MKLRNSFIVSTVILGLTTLGVCQGAAQALSGSIINTYGAPNPLWDLSKVSDWQDANLKMENSNSQVEIDFASPFAQDGKGRLAGAGSTTVQVKQQWNEDNGQVTHYDVSFPGTYVVKGSITSSKGVARVTCAIKAMGRASLEPSDSERTVTATSSSTFVIDPGAGSMTGRYSDKASAQGKGSISDRGTFVDPIPAALGNGSWTLVLNPVADAANKYTGTATITLNSGTIYPFSITGSYTPNTGASKLTLTGTDAALGSKLQLKLDGAVIKFISGKVSGQAIKILQ